MRGISKKQAAMLTLISSKSGVPKDHPLRLIELMAEEELNWSDFPRYSVR